MIRIESCMLADLREPGGQALEAAPLGPYDRPGSAIFGPGRVADARHALGTRGLLTPGSSTVTGEGSIGEGDGARNSSWVNGAFARPRRERDAADRAARAISGKSGALLMA